MNDAQKDTYLAWLADAHAMELGLVKTLEKQINATVDMPEIQGKLREHLEETKAHAAKVEECIKRHGGDLSKGKDWLSQVSSTISSWGSNVPSDALVKQAHSSYAAEHFEIATYNIIRGAAEELGDEETAAVCDDILADEEDMANWLIEQLPILAASHVKTL